MDDKDRVTPIFIAILLIVIMLSVAVREAKAESLDDAAVMDEAEVLAKVLYTECRGVQSKAEQAAVAWCVLNRVDHPAYPDTVYEVVTQPHQFAWRKSAPVTDELLALAQDVLLRWKLEKLGLGEVGRTLPKEYLFFRRPYTGYE